MTHSLCGLAKVRIWLVVQVIDTYEISITATNYFIEEFAGEGNDTNNLRIS